MIELKDIGVSYGEKVIYKNFCCRFDEGVNVVVGASGSGKTTLLNVICGLTEHEGVCKCGDAAVVFQNPRLAPVSALNNVAAVLRGKDAKLRAAEMLKMCRITSDKTRATRLSGGEQQRVALARAFASQRPVLLLDEPFRSLDPGVRRSLYATLDALLGKYAKTSVLVTHDIDEALLLADRVYFLSGRPAQLSLVSEITLPRAERDEFSDEFSALRRQLTGLFAE